MSLHTFLFRFLIVLFISGIVGLFLGIDLTKEENLVMFCLLIFEGVCIIGTLLYRFSGRFSGWWDRTWRQQFK